MLWIIDGLIYAFFTALYTLVNQHQYINGYVLGIWRGFGIAFIIAPCLFFVDELPDFHNWLLLIFQGVLIGIYDSHIFFASARFGANSTSRFLVLSILLTTIIWWLLTPKQFLTLFENATVFITLILCLAGFCVCYWYMLNSKISKRAFFYMLPATIALALMSITTKEIAVMNQNVWFNIIYYLTVSTFISGLYNLFMLILTKPETKSCYKMITEKKVIRIGVYIISFSVVLIAAKTLALRMAPNPGYVITLLLTTPLFVFMLSSDSDYKHNFEQKAGWGMMFFLCLIMLLVNSDLGIVD